MADDVHGLSNVIWLAVNIQYIYSNIKNITPINAEHTRSAYASLKHNERCCPATSGRLNTFCVFNAGHRSFQCSLSVGVS